MSSAGGGAAKAQEKQRTRSNGRFCKADEAVGETQGVQEKDERPVKCIHDHTEREFRKGFRKVFEGLMEKAEDGSVQHTRLLLHIGKFDDPKAKKRRGAKSLGAMLLDELKRRQDEREAATEKAAGESVEPVEAK